MPQKLELLKNPLLLLLTMRATEEEVRAAILLLTNTEIIDQNSSNFKQDNCPYYKYINIKQHDQRLAFNWLKKGDKFIFPPDIIAATLLPLNLGSFFIAANTIAPES